MAPLRYSSDSSLAESKFIKSSPRSASEDGKIEGIPYSNEQTSPHAHHLASQIPIDADPDATFQHGNLSPLTPRTLSANPRFVQQLLASWSSGSLPKDRSPSSSQLAQHVQSHTYSVEMDIKPDQAPISRSSSDTMSQATKLSSLPLRTNLESPRYRLRDITWLEGALRTLCPAITCALQNFCAENKSKDLPCAKRAWYGTHTLSKSNNGNNREWVAIPSGERLKVGRFRYGANQQLIVAQAPTESDWESGDMVVLVYDADSRYWKIWRYQADPNQIPASDRKVMCRAVLGTRAERQRYSKLPSRVSAVGTPYSIEYAEGDIAKFPEELHRMIKAFCDTHDPDYSIKLPAASEDRTDGVSLYELSSGVTREWYTIDSNEILHVGRFTYGQKHKILVVQAQQGSIWQGGAAKIIVHSRASRYYKIWDGQQNLHDIPACGELVKWLPDTEIPNKTVFATAPLGMKRRIADIDRSSMGLGGQARRVKPKMGRGENQHDNTIVLDDYVMKSLIKPEPKKTISAGRAKHLARTPTKSTLQERIQVLGNGGRLLYAASKLPTPTPSSDGSTAGSNIAIQKDSEAPEQSAGPSEGVEEPLIAQSYETNAIDDFDVNKVTLHFFGHSSVSGTPLLEGTFSETPDIKNLFARARVGKIATKDTLLLDIKVGDEDMLVQKNTEKDYERLKAAIMAARVTKISIRDGD